MTLNISPLRTKYSSRGIPSYEVEMSHEGLHKHRIIKGNDPSFVERKVYLQASEWNEQWSKRIVVQNRYLASQDKKRLQEEKKQFAIDTTIEAQNIMKELNHTLRHTLEVDDTIDWESLKDFSSFSKPQPVRNSIRPPGKLSVGPMPKRDHDKYQPQLSLLDKIFASRREKKIEEMSRLFENDYSKWEQERKRLHAQNEENQRNYELRLSEYEKSYQKQLSEWENDKSDFLKKQADQNKAIDEQRSQYEAGSSDAIISYCDMVLSNSDYLDFFPKEFEIAYNGENKVLIVDYLLPAPESLPTLVEVKYIASRDDFNEKHLSEAQLTKLYDDLIYQVTLRTIHELFEADVINAIMTIVFNGYVRALNKATGNEVTACILSIQVNRDEFLAFNLLNVEPKACFKQLKGVGSSKLHTITAIAPIVKMNKDDRRFVSSYDVVHTLDEGFNLASMSWEDFEHLVREVFEKELSSTGGEVKVTQASRDGGVDAVAFDPDPIRGGKIVIQAKRYTNIVGVSAVRDLYGTVMNEGASKGILVTTSDYGPDAYEFAKNKPITLLNGSNFLYLLERHGQKARIDLNEAKKLMQENK